jgi:lipolytic protein G-D-S-L family
MFIKFQEKGTMLKLLCAVFSLLLCGSLYAGELTTESLLTPKKIQTVAVTDPLLGCWLENQKRILSNLELAIRSDPEQANSLKADRAYLLQRIAEELEHFQTTPLPDPDKFYNVRDFGARGDGVHCDTEAIYRTIAMAAQDPVRRTVFLPRGKYLLAKTERDTGDLRIEGRHNILITGEPGTELLLPEPQSVGIRIQNCESVLIRNLKLTRLVSPFVTGQVIGFPKENVLRVRLDKFPKADPTAQYFRAGVGFHGTLRHYSEELCPGTIYPRIRSAYSHQNNVRVLKVGENIYDFVVDRVLPVQKHYRIGGRVSYYARSANQHAVLVHSSNRIRIEKVTINTSSSIAFCFINSDRPFLVGCRYEALPGTYISGAADSVFIRMSGLGGLFKDNVFRHHGDDFFNYHTMIVPVVEQAENVIYVHDVYWLYRRFLTKGARLGIVPISEGIYNTTREARILEVQQQEKLLKITLDRNPGKLSTTLTSKGLPDMIVLPDSQGHGMVILNNRFEDGISRFLAGGHNVLFSGNIIIDKLYHTFFMNICPEKVGVQGGEFASPRNWEFSDNRFITDVYPIKTFIRFTGPIPSSVPVASHIRFLDNIFVINRDMRNRLMDKRGGAYLTLRNNIVKVEEF